MASTGRPSTSVPIPASDSTFSGLTGAAAAYNGSATKVTMAAGVLAAGKAPLQPFRAQYQNALENDVAKRLDHLDLVDLTMVEGSTLTDSDGASPWRMRTACAHHLIGRPIAAMISGSITLWKSIDGGYNWTSWDSAAGRAYIDVAENLGSSIAAIATVSAATRFFGFNGTSWTSQALSNSPVGSCLVGDASRSKYYVGGRGGALGYSAVWSLADTGSGSMPMTETYIPHASSVVAVEHLAVGPSVNVGCSTAASFFWAPGDTSLSSGGAPASGAYTVRGLVYDASRSRFVAMTSDGTNTIFRTSTDGGTTWSILATHSNIVPNDKSLAIRGGVLVFGATYSSGDYLAVSADGGATLELRPNPIIKVGAGASKAIQHAAFHQDRLFVAGYRGTGLHAWGGALKSGRTY